MAGAGLLAAVPIVVELKTAGGMMGGLLRFKFFHNPPTEGAHNDPIVS